MMQWCHALVFFSSPCIFKYMYNIIMKSQVLLFLLVSSISFTVTAAESNGAIRLVDDGNYDPANTDGKVEIFYNGGWGEICASSDSNAPSVICKQLGYADGVYGNDTQASNVLIGGVTCESPDIPVLLQCQYTEAASCDDGNVMEVACMGDRIWESPYDGMVRLQDGYYSNQGRVEVYCNEGWTTICHNDGELNEFAAETICNQLGYNSFDNVDITPVPPDAIVRLSSSDLSCPDNETACLSSCYESCLDSVIDCTNGANITCSFTTDINRGNDNLYACQGGLSAAATAVIVVLGVIFIALIVAVVAIVVFFLFARGKVFKRVEYDAI